jgi:hypothetical protein
VNAFAQGDPLVGVWVSEQASILNVTTLRPDGHFRTERFSGIPSKRSRKEGSVAATR